MDNMLLVFYVNTHDFALQEVTDIHSIIEHYIKNLTQAENMIFFVLPRFDISGIKLECVNPQLVNKATYDSILDKLINIEKEFKESLKK